jgi:hypothetical protein
MKIKDIFSSEKELYSLSNEKLDRLIAEKDARNARITAVHQWCIKYTPLLVASALVVCVVSLIIERL